MAERAFTDADVARVARGLTKAQREALARHKPDRRYGSDEKGWPQSAHDASSFCKAGRALMDMKLLAWADQRSSATVLLPLGLAVRAFIQEKGNV